MMTTSCVIVWIIVAPDAARPRKNDVNPRCTSESERSTNAKTRIKHKRIRALFIVTSAGTGVDMLGDSFL